jgi:FtsZ-binding cell division protein ZapB
MGNLWRELEQDNKQLALVNRDLFHRSSALEGLLTERGSELAQVQSQLAEAERARDAATARADALATEGKQYLAVVREQAELLGQSRDTLVALQAGVDALKGRLEAVSLERDNSLQAFDALSKDHRSVSRQRDQAQAAVTRAKEECAQLETDREELKAQVHVAEQSQRTKARQVHAALIEKRRYEAAYERALAFVHNKQIPTTIGAGGVRVQKQLQALLVVESDDADSKHTERARRAAAESLLGTTAVPLAKDAPARGARGGSHSGSDSDEDDESGDEGAVQGPSGSGPSVSAPAGSADRVQTRAKPLSARVQKLTVRERLSQQQELIQSLQTTVKALRDRNASLTQRFRAATDERRRLQSQVQSLQQQLYLPAEHREPETEAVPNDHGTRRGERSLDAMLHEDAQDNVNLSVDESAILRSRVAHGHSQDYSSHDQGLNHSHSRAVRFGSPRVTMLSPASSTASGGQQAWDAASEEDEERFDRGYDEEDGDDDDNAATEAQNVYFEEAVTPDHDAAWERWQAQQEVKQAQIQASASSASATASPPRPASHQPQPQSPPHPAPQPEQQVSTPTSQWDARREAYDYDSLLQMSSALAGHQSSQTQVHTPAHVYVPSPARPSPAPALAPADPLTQLQDTLRQLQSLNDSHMHGNATQTQAQTHADSSMSAIARAASPAPSTASAAAPAPVPASTSASMSSWQDRMQSNPLLQRSEASISGPRTSSNPFFRR